MGVVTRLVAFALLVVGCDTSAPSFPDTGPFDAGVDSGSDAGSDAGESDAGPAGCSCAPGLHNDRIVVVSDDAELWAYDPVGDAFERLGSAGCFGQSDSFSMGVDARGRAWIQYVGSEDLFTVDVNDPSAGCADPGYDPGANPDFGLVGMSFARDEASAACDELYLWTYDGSGLFEEGPDLGRLGALDPITLETRTIATVDFDGGELAGTSDGRLYALAGDPARLFELDTDSGAILAEHSLGSFTLSTAFAFAFFGGSAWLFTEAPPAACDPCLERECAADVAACRADPPCAAELECAIGIGEITDECGGRLPAPMFGCLERCAADCFVSPLGRVSRVTRYDFDTGVVETVNPAAPIRIVGAGNSSCVPLI